MTVYVFKYGVGSHFWAAILDLNVKMVSERSKNVFIRPGLPHLVGKVDSFAFFGTFGSRDITFNGFQYGVGGHLGFWRSILFQNIMNIILLYLWCQNDTSYALLVNLVQEISLFLVFNMVLAAILKHKLLQYSPAIFGRYMGAYCSLNMFILSNQSRN